MFAYCICEMYISAKSHSFLDKQFKFEINSTYCKMYLQLGNRRESFQALFSSICDTVCFDFYLSCILFSIAAFSF